MDIVDGVLYKMFLIEFKVRIINYNVVLCVFYSSCWVFKCLFYKWCDEEVIFKLF